MNPEVGGVYLDPDADSEYSREILSGLRGIMASLKMIDAPEVSAKKQLLFGVKSRLEVIRASAVIALVLRPAV